MSAQERTEEVLRQIHTMFSMAEAYNGSKRYVIIDKNRIMDMLKELNDALYDMQEEYELTQAGRDRARRRQEKEGEDIVFEAERQADDVYAGAIMYTENALHDIQDIIEETKERMNQVLLGFDAEIDAAAQSVKQNRNELKAELQNMVDEKKYMNIIAEENERRKKRKDAEEGKDKEDDFEEPPQFADVKPEIKINKDYFEAHGLTVETEDENGAPEEKLITSEDLDAEYFDWVEDEEEKADKKETERKKKKKKGLF
ncbi:MAG: hypothetical protein IIZ61_02800 [Lachnospiraceae bacterium]|nr:hypothetical protein [Lachnospiraceae bacterium]